MRHTAVESSHLSQNFSTCGGLDSYVSKQTSVKKVVVNSKLQKPIPYS